MGHFGCKATFQRGEVIVQFAARWPWSRAESHAGGRSAVALRFADLDALVVTGKATTPSCLAVGNHHIDIQDVHYLWGQNVDAAGKMLRRMYPGSGHRSILRIGPAGEIGSSMACINVDTYRHFGRLGSGAVMGAKKLKAISVSGTGRVSLARPDTITAIARTLARSWRRPPTSSRIRAPWKQPGSVSW